MKDNSRVDWSEIRARVEAFERHAQTATGHSDEYCERVFRERAERLARPPDLRDANSGTDAIMIVALGPERFGIPLGAVAEVIGNPCCSPVPGAPPAVAGAIQVRGEICPVFHLSRALNLPDAAAGSGSPVVLLRRRGATAGVLVERVENIRDAGQGRREAPPGHSHVLWMTADMVPVLDPDGIFPEEMA